MNDETRGGREWQDGKKLLFVCARGGKESGNWKNWKISGKSEVWLLGK